MDLSRRKSVALGSGVLLCFLTGILCSCSMLSSQKGNEQALRVAADRFNTSLRWEDYKAAATRTAPSRREDFWNQVERLRGQVRIMDYEVMDVSLNDTDRSVTVTLRYRFFHKRNPQLQTTTVRQKWEFSEREHVWQVVRNDMEQLMP